MKGGGRQSHKSAANFRLIATHLKEHELQASVAEFLDWLLIPPAFYTAFPAGWGWLPPSTAARLKKCGLKPGMPDLLVFNVIQQIYPKIIGIELKVGNNKPSVDQTLMHARLLAVGIPVFTCWSIDEVAHILKQEGVPLRARWNDAQKTHHVAEEGSATQSP